MDTHLPPRWIKRLSALLGIPSTKAATDLFTAWARAEGGTAKWNPLNTTYGLRDSTVYNSAGVQDYTTPVSGLCATALTLILPAYSGLLGELQAGNKTAVEIVEANPGEFDTWGTGAENVLKLLA